MSLTTVHRMPTRVLGRTGEQIPILGLGTGPAGMGLSDRRALGLIHRAIDMGVTYIDTAPGYGRAQKQLKRALKKRRAEVFLATKTPANTYQEALDSLEQSMSTLGVDQVDIAFVHSMGGRDPDLVVSDEGALAGLAEARRRGWTRFIGFTAHNETRKSVTVLNQFTVDAVMLGMNYADRYTYDFEGKVLPVARAQNVGVLAMKAFGGARAMKYERPVPSALVEDDALHLAYLYAVGLAGVSSTVIGMFTEDELVQNVEWACDVRDLTPEEEADLERLGRQSAQRLGAHYGPEESL